MSNLDTLGRPLRDLRISITDRCNFRCVYCMPREVFGPNFQFLARDELLTYEEITRFAKIAVESGIEKIRITGGEPLIRRDLPLLIKDLEGLKGLKDLTLTTNGALLKELALPLYEAGLSRITVSLDALEEDVFRLMTDSTVSVQTILDGIEKADQIGFNPIKINVVVKRGVNENSVIPIARYFKDRGHIVRFIEFMDVGNTNAWSLEKVVPSQEILEQIDAELPIEPIEANYRGEVARRYRYRDGASEIGIIASITQPFCGDCTRARLSPEGELFTCLFGSKGHDFRSLLRNNNEDELIRQKLASVWASREDRYSDIRTAATKDLIRVEMSHIGG